jgi:hypothetical protein
VPDYVSNLVYGWEVPRLRAFYERLARSLRLILFDKRGTGLSDHGPHFAALEIRRICGRFSRRPDLRAPSSCDHTKDARWPRSSPRAIRSERGALALFHPVVAGPGTTDREWQAQLSDLRERWRTREFSDELLREGAPTLYANEEERRWHANLHVGATPAVAYALNRAWAETDLRKLHVGKVSGIAVNTGARIATSADPGEVLVSSTVRDLVAGSGLEFDDRGARDLKGIPGAWHLFAALLGS